MDLECVGSCQRVTIRRQLTLFNFQRLGGTPKSHRFDTHSKVCVFLGGL